MIVDLSHVHSIFKSIGLITCHIITLSISSTLYLWAHTLMRIASFGWYNRVMCEHTHNHNNIMHTCASKLQTVIVYLALVHSNWMFMHTHVQHAHLSGRMACTNKIEKKCAENQSTTCVCANYSSVYSISLSLFAKTAWFAKNNPVDQTAHMFDILCLRD